MPGHTYTEVSRAIHSEALCARVRLVRTDPGAAGTGHGAYNAYTEALKNPGVMTGVNRLQPASTATTVRVANGKSQVLDGPYADSEEQLGGYYIIDVPDLDAALSWAARCPAASHGLVEVRPLWGKAA
jgi:hypothetical protein